ncbi:MAG: Rpn family recombination-promoting nuclease/putative transposase [Lachnospiraceae bacterium]|nr:Rpn family recombination-promoting nuclease/putative transposase [Lachnospiraceae bacterium]
MEIISPKMDFAFRELMEDAEVRRYFICDALNMPVEQVKETRLGNSFLRRRHQKMKQGILDVKVFLHDGTRINLEMQLRRQKFWGKRSLYYLAKMYADILFMGEHFDRLRRCIGISILDFNLTEDDRYHSVYRMRDETGKDYSDLLELHIIELRKTLTGNSRMDDWLRLFNAETEEDLHMIKTKNAGVQKAKYVIQEMSLTESLREAVEYYRKKKMDRKSEDAYVYDQGKEAGEQIGIEIGRERGIEIGRERGIVIGREAVLLDLVLSGKLDVNTAAETCGITPEEFQEKLAKAKKQNR